MERGIRTAASCGTKAPNPDSRRDFDYSSNPLLDLSLDWGSSPHSPRSAVRADRRSLSACDSELQLFGCSVGGIHRSIWHCHPNRGCDGGLSARGCAAKDYGDWSADKGNLA